MPSHAMDLNMLETLKKVQKKLSFFRISENSAHSFIMVIYDNFFKVFQFLEEPITLPSFL